MNIRRLGSCALLTVAWGVMWAAGVEVRKLPRLHGAALLVGYDSLFSGSPSLFLAVTTPGETFMVLPEVGQPETRHDEPIYPNISTDGRIISCLRVKSTNPRRLMVATYSIPDKTWTEYVEAYEILGVAISPDKTQLAFASNENEGGQIRLCALDTRTGVTRVLSRERIDGHMSWSPDGKRLAYQVQLSSGAARTYEAAIDVLDLSTGTTRRLGKGQNPAWSPSGEWIAYLDSSGTWPVSTKCMAAHPDGSGEQVLYAFPRGRRFAQQRYFIYAPVWSPDSKQLLLNERPEWDEPVVNERMIIHLLDFATHRLTTKFRRAPPVLGWASWK